MKIQFGGHLSSGKGLEGVLKEAQRLNINAVQIFASSPQTWEKPKHSQEDMHFFHLKKSAFGVENVVIHGIYLINLASFKPNIWHGSIVSLVNDLKFADKIGASCVIFHPGSHLGLGLNKGIERAAEGMTKVLDAAGKTKAKLAIEITAGHGNLLGDNFEELAAMIKALPSKYKRRVGVCLDTCHMYASGYDISTPEKFDAVLKDFDKKIGLHKLLAFHLNDSKFELESHKDRHEIIGKGHLGKEIFGYIVNHPKLMHVPFVLETPDMGGDYKSVLTIKKMMKN